MQAYSLVFKVSFILNFHVFLQNFGFPTISFTFEFSAAAFVMTYIFHCSLFCS